MPADFEPAHTALSRRQMLAASGTGLLAATAAVPANARTGPTVRNRSKSPGTGNGTPEQVHLTWGDDPATSVVVSWTSPDTAVRPRVRIGQRVIRGQARAAADPATGETRRTYHARVGQLRPGATYAYAVTADNDRNQADPFSGTFTTAPQGRAKLRFTSFGDLPAAGPRLVPAAMAYAAETVESFQPLFHLLSGDSSGTLDAGGSEYFGDSVQTSAANRPWMPVPGLSGAGAASFLPGYAPPPHDGPGSEGQWYSFRAGSVLVVSLSGDDGTGQPTGDVGHPGGAQARWLKSELAAARQDPAVDWIVAQAHRDTWLPLFDEYEVDLVISGQHAGYERSFPVRGFGPAVSVSRPRTATTADSGVFDTSQGTVHLFLGGGFLGGGVSSGAEVAGAEAWSARRDYSGGHGIAVFDVDPGTEADGQTSITVTYYRAAGDLVSGDDVAGDYAEFETFTLIRPRSDKRRWHARESPATVRA